MAACPHAFLYAATAAALPLFAPPRPSCSLSRSAAVVWSLSPSGWVYDASELAANTDTTRYRHVVHEFHAVHCEFTHVEYESDDSVMYQII